MKFNAILYVFSTKASLSIFFLVILWHDWVLRGLYVLYVKRKPVVMTGVSDRYFAIDY